MKITKMHGLGNDFILIDGPIENCDKIAVELCERRLNVGADGLIVVEKSEVADAKMRIFNADGSEAEMCGNGIRCFARYVYDNKTVDKLKMTVETLAGIISPEIIVCEGKPVGIRVDMGLPDYNAKNIPVIANDPMKMSVDIDDNELYLSSVLVGVPHAVVFTDKLDEEKIADIGAKIEKHVSFPRKINVNFAKLQGDNSIRVKTWERGVGRTLACGTGSCATALVAYKKGFVQNKVNILLDAGELLIEIAEDDRMFMTGAAQYVFSGETL